MSVADDLMKLKSLHDDGVLSEGEFESAKRRLLDNSNLPRAVRRQPVRPPQSFERLEDASLGRAANRWVDLQMASMVVGLILFVVFFLFFFLPMQNRMQSDFGSFRGGPEIVITMEAPARR